VDGSRIASDDMIVWRGSEAVLCPACWCGLLATAGPDGVREPGPTLLCRLSKPSTLGGVSRLPVWPVRHHFTSPRNA